MRARWLAFALLIVSAPRAVAQPGASVLTISGFSGAFGNSTITNFDSEYIVAVSPVGWSLVRNNGGGNRQRTMTLSISASSATFGGGDGTKPIGDLEWQDSANPGSWQSVTTTPAVVVSIVRGSPTTTTGNVDLRIRMPWATTPPGSYTATIVWTLTVTPP